MNEFIISGMKEPSRRCISAVLVLGIFLAMCHIPVTVDGAVTLAAEDGKCVAAGACFVPGPIVKEGVKIIGKELLKKGKLLIGTLTGKFDRIHKSVERAVDWIKDNKYTLARSAVTTAVEGGLSFVYDESTHVTTVTDGDYSVEFVPDDENNQYNIYVNDEDCGTLVYENLENCSDEQRAKELEKAKKNAIAEYKKKHR